MQSNLAAYTATVLFRQQLGQDGITKWANFYSLGTLEKAFHSRATVVENGRQVFRSMLYLLILNRLLADWYGYGRAG